jgi:hypothetical protein
LDDRVSKDFIQGRLYARFLVITRHVSLRGEWRGYLPIECGRMMADAATSRRD